MRKFQKSRTQSRRRRRVVFIKSIIAQHVGGSYINIDRHTRNNDISRRARSLTFADRGCSRFDDFSSALDETDYARPLRSASRTWTTVAISGYLFIPLARPRDGERTIRYASRNVVEEREAEPRNRMRISLSLTQITSAGGSPRRSERSRGERSMI